MHRARDRGTLQCIANYRLFPSHLALAAGRVRRLGVRGTTPIEAVPHRGADGELAVAVALQAVDEHGAHRRGGRQHAAPHPPGLLAVAQLRDCRCITQASVCSPLTALQAPSSYNLSPIPGSLFWSSSSTVTHCCHLEGEGEAGLQDHAAGAAKARVTPAECLRLHIHGMIGSYPRCNLCQPSRRTLPHHPAAQRSMITQATRSSTTVISWEQHLNSGLRLALRRGQEVARPRGALPRLFVRPCSRLRLHVHLLGSAQGTGSHTNRHC